MPPDRRPVPNRRIAGLLAATVITMSVAGCTHDKTSYTAFCKQLKKTPSMTSAVTGYTDADSQELQKRLTSARAAYAKLADTAPDEIESAVKTVVALADIVIDAVAQHPGDQAALARQVAKRSAAHKDAQAATARLATAAK